MWLMLKQKSYRPSKLSIINIRKLWRRRINKRERGKAGKRI
jgi:hypothetical protein